MSAKYPRSFHLPWSPGGTSDDKRMADVSPLVGVELVITEKCDGSNLTYTRESVFSRSHAGPPAHPSFDLAKATHARIRHQLSPSSPSSASTATPSTRSSTRPSRTTPWSSGPATT